MKLFEPYQSLDRTLLMLREQSRESVEFARSFLPPGRMHPREIFDFLHGEVVYKHDPEGIELLQTMQTLFSPANYHGIYGAGDCDCFTLTSLACLYAKGYGSGLGIYLVGRSTVAPVHIYASVHRVPFDLTNNNLGKERPYPYKQFLPVRLF